MMRGTVCSLLSGVLLASSAVAAQTSEEIAGRYQGRLGCETCAKVNYQLDLFADGAYYLRALPEQAGTKVLHDDVGRWVWATDRQMLALKGHNRIARYFNIIDSDTLRMADSGDGATLKRDNALTALEPSGIFSGLFRYMADAANFRDCASGRSWRVEMAGAYIELERAYTQKTQQQDSLGAPLMVQVDATVAMLPPMEGDALVPTLHINQWKTVLPGEACPAPVENAPLPQTRWVLTHVKERPVHQSASLEFGQKPLLQDAYLVFDEGSGSVEGTGACNPFTGRFTLSGNGGIKIDSLQAPSAKCMEGEALEQIMLSVLRSSARWRIAGDRLELSDDSGKPLVRFQSE